MSRLWTLTAMAVVVVAASDTTRIPTNPLVGVEKPNGTAEANSTAPWPSNMGTRRLRVFVNNPSFGYSHMSFMGYLADLLVEAGHQVHVQIPLWDPAERRNGTHKAQRVHRYHYADPSALPSNPNQNPFNEQPNWSNGSNHFFTTTQLFCRQQTQTSDYTDWIRSQSFDVAILEIWDICAFFHLHAAGVPNVLVVSSTSYPDQLSAAWRVPMPRSYVPFMSTLTSLTVPTLSFGDRLLNVLLDFFASFPISGHYSEIRQMFTKRYGSNIPKFEELLVKVKFAFVNRFPMFDHPRPITHKFKPIGGITLQRQKIPQLSNETAKIFEKAKSGVILMSFGSLIELNGMKMEKKRKLFSTMGSFIDYEFIVRITADEETKQLIAEHPNIHAKEWIDQLATLAHPKTKAFVTHCGNSGMSESIWLGVPMIVVPFRFDQHDMAALALSRGVGVYVDYRELSGWAFRDALHRLLTEPSFALNAEKLRRKIRNHPEDAAELFVRHVEYSTKFASNEEMHLAAVKLSWMVEHNLDIWLTAAALVLMALIILTFAVRFAFKFGIWGLRRAFDLRERMKKKYE